MGQATLHIITERDRAQAALWLSKAPLGTFIRFKHNKRTVDQNSLLWSLLFDISQQVLWHGMKMDDNSWKLVFMSALQKELRLVPNLEGNGFVNIGHSSSDLEKGEFCDLLTMIINFGDNPSQYDGASCDGPVIFKLKPMPEDLTSEPQARNAA